MTAHLVHFTNPFHPQLERKVAPLRRGIRIDTVLRQNALLKGTGLKTRRTSTFVVMVNGNPVLQKNWNRRLGGDDMMVVTQLPRGGGGGSNPLKMVAMIALVALAVYTGGVVAGAYGSTLGAVASATIMLGGTMILNLLFPVKMDTLDTASRDDVSPTYNLSAQGNSARLLQAIPVIYGRFRTFPDLASQPYTENRGNNQFLYQLYCVTQGMCDIEQIRIGDADISSYGEVQYEIIPPGGQVTLFPDNVVTSVAVGNNTLFGPNEPQYSVVGPFPVCPPGESVTSIGVDVGFPGGAYAVDDGGNFGNASASFIFEYRKIDDSGNPTGPWQTLLNQTETFASRQPQLLSYKVDVPSARYQVQAYRSNNAPTDAQTVSMIQWGSLRGYVPSIRTYGNVTLLAMIIQATNNINGTVARQINVIAQRKLPHWDPVNGWQAEAATRNPAWAIADAIRNAEYGRGLPDSYYSLQELYRLSQVWDSRGDEFNGVFDSTIQFWDALGSLCAVGRAVPMYYAGVIDIIRNEPRTLPTAMFGPQNMIEGSFSTKYLFPEVDSPDHIVMEYTDKDTWDTATVICALPGMSTLNPSTVSLVGITNRDQAWREGMSLAAKNRDQRRAITFSTGREGYLPRYGDPVQVSHDVPAWGYSGKVLAKTIQVDTTKALLELTEPAVFTPGVTHYIAFRKRDGKVDGPYVATPSDRNIENEVFVTGSTDAIAALYVSTGIREDFTQYQFGPSTRAGITALLLSAKPSNDKTVALTLVNYAESVHIAENGGAVPIPPPASNLPQVPVVPIIDSVTVELTAVIGEQNVVAKPARGADYYEFQISSNGTSWASVGVSGKPTFVVHLSPGQWWVRVRGVGLLPGPWSTWQGNIGATSLPIPELDLLTASDDKLFGIELEWVIKAGNGGIAASVELWWGLNDNLGTAARLIELPVPASKYMLDNLNPGQEAFFWGRVRDKAGRLGAWYNAGIGIRGMASNNSDLIRTALSGQIDKTLLAQSLREEIESGGGAALAVAEVRDDLAAMYTIKTQLTSGGRTVLAGIGVGVENNAGVLESQVLVMADRFAVIRPDTGSGATVSPFIIQGNNIYMASAFIQDGAITNAKIANQISSNNFVNAYSGWLLDKGGTFQLNGPGGTGRLIINNNNLQVFDANGVLRVRLGLW